MTIKIRPYDPHVGGFTLVEILIVVAVLAIIAAIGVPGLYRARQPGQEASPSHAIVPVFYATDRARTSTQPLEYGPERNTSDSLQLGRFDVSIPRDHRLATVERPTIWTLWREDPAKHFIVVGRKELGYDTFYADIRGIVGRSERKEVLVFVHGFNVAFESAVYRTAQIAYDLGFDGAPILYSWPSEGAFVRYPVDLNNNEWTIPHLRWFLEDVASKSRASKVHLIAHSMGNRALVNALNQIAAAAQPVPRPRFNQVLLTAPDIDTQTFASLASAIHARAERLTLYASSNDEALKLSSRYQGYQRAGDTTPTVVVVPGIDTLDVSAVDTNLLGHFYYAENRSVISDMFYLLRDARPPAARFGLRPEGKPPRQWWIFRP